ncbi:uncharacterized protein LOC118414843 isoform X1 [Branchiostoma floridae]|uniref:Uncharacterized protein LOC118414843 isoform X1 n=1 Tax=Branchiostoma floridae TaxID=7739 RepID=A0A9J7L3L2_BRAFL|nr:uncharacterized protein LOC118414843 isoform X1 [Branchiostoma floridae]
MGKLTVEATGKTDPEDPPPYPLEPLPTKPGLQTNIVVPEAEPGYPPNINTRLWNFLFCICTLLECWNEQDITLVTVCVVLVALVILGVKLAKKCKMARKHGCSDSGEEGRMEDGDCEEMTVEANGKTSPEDPPPYPLEPLPTKPGLQTNMVVPEAEPGHPPVSTTDLKFLDQALTVE